MAVLPDYIEVEKNQVLGYLLRRADRSDEGQGAIEAADEQPLRGIVEDLEKLEQAPINLPEGGLRLLIKGTHINLRGSLWEILQLGVELTVEHTNPIAVALAVGNAVHSISDKITHLDDPIELLVAKSIVRVAAAKKRSGRILAIPEVSVDEITVDLRAQGLPDAPSNLAELLAHLCGQEILKDVFYDGRGPFYAVTF
jgi:hypothetical protein